MNPARGLAAVAALVAIVAITGAWWALALWPVDGSAPEWLLRTREVCFGATVDTLPDAAGWILLVGQPVGLALLLAFVWGPDLRAGIGQITARRGGQVAAGALAGVLTIGVVSVGVRVRTAGFEPFETGGRAGGPLTRVNDPAPGLKLIDQAGREVTLDAFRGRPLLVTFAYAHCATVCPLIVAEVAKARRTLGDAAPDALILTLDPLRDTPGRLPTIARQWDLDQRTHVVSGAPEVVERALNAWRVPRARNDKTGDITHPSIVYVVDAEGRIRYVTAGAADVIVRAVRAL